MKIVLHIFRMGGCRCVYRNCQSSTNLTPGLHYFHFPIRDPERCDQWIKNARKQSLRVMPREKLRNKVICSLHFEDRYFTNEKHDRLIHNAIPTLGCEDAQEEELSPDSAIVPKDELIMLIPTNNDNTKFILPDEGFSGMSYTIYDDAVIPSSTVQLMNQNEKTKMFAVLKKFNNENEPPKLPKRPKFTITSVNKVSTPLTKTAPTQIKAEPVSPEHITSYSLSTFGDDLRVELSQKKDNFDQLIEQTQGETPLLDNDISLQQKGDNEYSIAVVSENIQQNVIDITETIQNNPNISTIQQNIIAETRNTDFNVTPEKEYIRMIRNNSKQIIKLKRLVNKQNRFHKYLLQKKQLCKFRRKPWDKYKLLDNLKKYVKPSLMAILKLEVLPSDDVVLTDGEEKFITDLYTEDPDCYDILRKKYQWNLPHAENI